MELKGVMFKNGEIVNADGYTLFVRDYEFEEDCKKSNLDFCFQERVYKLDDSRVKIKYWYECHGGIEYDFASFRRNLAYIVIKENLFIPSVAHIKIYDGMNLDMKFKKIDHDKIHYDNASYTMLEERMDRSYIVPVDMRGIIGSYVDFANSCGHPISEDEAMLYFKNLFNR